jgi:NADPH2:quinone reductase
VKLVRNLGADVAIDARQEDVSDQVRRWTPAGADAILALAGGDALERALQVLRPGGRLAYPNGIEPEPKTRRGVRFIPDDAITGVREFRKLNAAVEAAKLKVPIERALPLIEAAKAHERLAKGHVPGKIVLRVRNP